MLKCQQTRTLRPNDFTRTLGRHPLSIYVPLRYYHRPRAHDDAHGYGKPSRFLTQRLQALCDVVRPDADEEPAATVSGTVRLQVSLDHLFR
jgi:DNA helicase II / ATP-dependent DNA helicase PcrA